MKVPEYQIRKMISAKGIDPETIDYRAIWDSALSRAEAFALIRKAISRLGKPNYDNMFSDMMQQDRYATQMIDIVGWQTGKTNVAIDKKRKALPCGWRETWYGHRYRENRRNRCDQKGGI